MFRKVIASVGKRVFTLLNRINCEMYKKAYPTFLRWSGVRIEPDYQKGGFDPWISPSAYFDPGYPGLIHIGRGTTISFDACFLAHDYSIDKALFSKYGDHGLVLGKIFVGRNCFIGARAMILPGTTIGEGAIVGANAVVKGDVPAGAVVAGNPARVVGSAKNTLERHIAKGDISYWRGTNFDVFEPHLPIEAECEE